MRIEECKTEINVVVGANYVRVKNSSRVQKEFSRKHLKRDVDVKALAATLNLKDGENLVNRDFLLSL